MRYVVTGAGMLGTAIAERLRRDGHDVVIVDVVNVSGVTRADLRDRSAIRDALAGADGVFHTAALHGFRDATDLDYFEVNVAGTWTLLDVMAELGIRRLVHSSTIGVYGEAAHIAIGPDTPTAASATPYNESKRIAEEVVAFFGRRHGIQAVCLRLGAFRELLERSFGEVPTEWADSGSVVALDDLVDATVNAMARLPLPRPAYVVVPSAAGIAYEVDASATESDLSVSLRPYRP